MNALPKQSKPIKRPNHVDYVSGLPCLVCGGQSVVHHVNERGHGRETRNDEWIVPLCAYHHNMSDVSIHSLGSNDKFKKLHGIDLIHEAQMLWNETVYKGRE